MMAKYSAVGVIFDGTSRINDVRNQEKTLESSIDDARKLKRKCWSVASLKTEEKILKLSISDCGRQTPSVRTQFL
jgi:hypothetical protein